MVIDGELCLPLCQVREFFGLETEFTEAICGALLSAGALALSANSGMYSEASSFSFWTCFAHSACSARRLFALGPLDFRVNSLQLCLMRLPLEVSERVFAGELGDVIHGSDVGEARLLGVL